MKDVECYLEEIMKDKGKEEELRSLVREAMEYLEKVHPEHYKMVMCSLHKLAYGPHFDKDTAEYAVACMKNVDGTTGETWTMEQTNAFAKRYGITQLCDWYYAINMLVSDAKNVIGNNDKMYCELAKAIYFTDPDMKDGKLFLEWMSTH